MDFNPCMKYQLIRKTVQEFAENEILHRAAEMDKGPGFPEDLMEKMKPLHYFGLQVPGHLGGAGLDSTSYAIVVEEISRVSAALGGVEAAFNTGDIRVMDGTALGLDKDFNALTSSPTKIISSAMGKDLKTHDHEGDV